MSVSLFLNFDGDCREALGFYEKAFGHKAQRVMTYAEMPPDPAYPIADEDRNRIAYAGIPACGVELMFCDGPSSEPVIKGNNVSPTLGFSDMDELRRVFAALSEGGEVYMDLQKTFWSDLYGMVGDRYGITWQLLCEET